MASTIPVSSRSRGELMNKLLSVDPSLSLHDAEKMADAILGKSQSSHSTMSVPLGSFVQGNYSPVYTFPTTSTHSTTFKIGDIVVAQSRNFREYGKVGEILGFSDRDGQFGVCFDEDVGGHDLSHILPGVKCEQGKGVFIDAGYLLLLNDEEVKKRKKKLSPKMTFDITKMEALVIKQEVREEIVAVLEQYKNHDKLFEEWGLGEVIEYGRGMTFMFYGGPGTGKTFGAHCIAKSLGTELLVLTAAEVQSSEPGGANRAIQNAFSEAKRSGKVLFLDECDSLVSNRADLGMVLASEVNTLLTEIEKFEGVCILATNRVEHMDEALERRISLIVEFPKPDYDSRKKIWAKLLPKKLPLGKGVSADELAKEELTGGQIKNVVLQAARMALAGHSDRVELKHFELSVARIHKSKNLMGTASRYRQGMVKDDFDVGSGRKTKRGFKDFLKTDMLDEDVDIDTQ